MKWKKQVRKHAKPVYLSWTWSRSGFGSRFIYRAWSKAWSKGSSSSRFQIWSGSRSGR